MGQAELYGMTRLRRDGGLDRDREPAKSVREKIAPNAAVLGWESAFSGIGNLRFREEDRSESERNPASRLP